MVQFGPDSRRNPTDKPLSLHHDLASYNSVRIMMQKMFRKNGISNTVLQMVNNS